MFASKQQAQNIELIVMSITTLEYLDMQRTAFISIFIGLFLTQFVYFCSEAFLTSTTFRRSDPISISPDRINKSSSKVTLNTIGNILFIYAPNAKTHLHSLLPIAKRFDDFCLFRPILSFCDRQQR